MGKHATVAQKVELLVQCEYESSIAKAAEKVLIALSTAKDIQLRAGLIQAEYAEQGLPPPSYKEQVTQQLGSGAKPKITEEEITLLLKACTTNKKHRKKL